MKTPGRRWGNQQLALVIVVAVSLVSGLGLWAWSHANQRNRMQGIVSASLANLAGAQSLTWREHDRFAYELSVAGLMTLYPGNENARVVEYDLGARLCGRVLETRNGSAMVGMQLRNLTRKRRGMQEVRVQEAMGLPFIVLFEGGMPATLRFPEELDAQAQYELAEVVRTFQVTLPDRLSSSWNTLEEHRDGRYSATYMVDSDGVWNKSKVAYVSVGATANKFNIDTIQVIHSSATLRPATSGSWLQEADVVDEIQFVGNRTPFIRVKKHSVLKALAGTCDPDSDLAGVSGPEDLLNISGGVELENTGPVAVEARAAGPEDVARFRRLASAFTDNNGRRFADVHDLADMLEEFPELSAEVPALLMQDNIAELVEAGFIHALELAGNATSQSVLGEIALEPAYGYPNRLRSVIALSGGETPSPQSVETLWLMTVSGGGPEGENLASAALLALGNMSKKLREAGDESYRELTSRLGAGMAGQDAGTKTVLLAALTNSRDPDLLPYVTLELEAPHPMVRTAAIEAISSVDSPESFDLIVTRLEHEDNDRVRNALVAAISRLGHKDPQVFETFVEAVKSEENEEVRGAMASYLADNIDVYPAGRGAVEAFLRDARNSAAARADVSSVMRSRLRARKANPVSP